MTLQQFVSILRARKLLLIAIFLVTVFTTFVVSVLLPKQYTASASVVIDVKSPDPISGMVLQGMMTPTYMATQVDIIGSSRVAQRAIRELRLAETPSLREQWNAETKGEGDYEAWLTALVQRQLQISPSRESNVITISYSAADPRFAAAMANAFTSSYINTSVELRAEPRANLLKCSISRLFNCARSWTRRNQGCQPTKQPKELSPPMSELM